jgi:hypothetical protein
MGDPTKSLLENLLNMLNIQEDWQRAYDQLRQRFGVVGAIVVLLVIAGFLGWWSWDHIKKLPGVPWLIELFTRGTLPPTPEGRLTIRVARLEKDPDRNHEETLLDDLRKFVGVEVRTIDRTFKWPLEEEDPDEVARTKAKARGLLKRKRADGRGQA